MPISYGRGLPPEKVSHTYVDQQGVERTYRAFQRGMNWDVEYPSGVTVPGKIRYSNRWEAAAQLTSLAMEDHDDRRRNRPSPIRDRIVSVDDVGNVTGATIIPQQRRGS